MDQESRLSHSKSNIVIVGFMGVGKSTVGQLLAEQLQWNFVDLDQIIEQEFDCTIPEIFEIWGESVFRSKERELAFDLCSKNKTRHVIALGGGAFAQSQIRRHCMNSCTVVWLDLSWESWRGCRLPIVVDSRPLLKNLSVCGIEELFQRRRTLYDSHYRFLIDGLEPNQIVTQMMDVLNLREDYPDSVVDPSY